MTPLSKPLRIISFFGSLILLALFVILFLRVGPWGIFNASFPPVEKIFIEKVVFSPEKIELRLMNDGQKPVTLSQILVKDMFWRFEIEPSHTLQPKQTGRMTLLYPWEQGEPISFTLISNHGVTFEKEVPIASITPTSDFTYHQTFVLLGVYAGLIPVILGMFFFPFLRGFQRQGYDFFLMMTVGILILLGFESLKEAFGLLTNIAQTWNGFGLLVTGFFITLLLLLAISRQAQKYQQSVTRSSDLVWAYLIALGIGLHNFGEGLSIGSAYGLGQLSLGAMLVVGFMIHNFTEGIAIVSPIIRHSFRAHALFRHLTLFALVAGGPTILGSFVGGFFYSAPFYTLALSIGAGAIFFVVMEIAGAVLRKSKEGEARFTPLRVWGLSIGLVVMYLTGLLVR